MIKLKEMESKPLDIVNDPESMIKLSEFYLKMSEFQAKYDHPLVALDCYITSKTLLHWAKVALRIENQ